MNRQPPRFIPGALPTELYGQNTNVNARGVCLAMWGYTLIEMPARRSYSKCTERTFPTDDGNDNEDNDDCDNLTDDGGGGKEGSEEM